jgi:choline dehydrogenase-like flavoprotein
MAASPEFGVVDENCKVFGVENLHVAGSSVFATGGACNPTMPLLQLALRLADHLNQEWAPQWEGIPEQESLLIFRVDF